MVSIDCDDYVCYNISDHSNIPTNTVTDERSYPSSDLEWIGDKKQYIVYSRVNADTLNAW